MGIQHFGHPGPHPEFFVAFVIARLVVFAIFWLIPVIIGLTYVRRDANRRGQPGWLWAMASIFLSWLAILAYLIVRAATGPTNPPAVTNTPASPPAL
jgi:hypothetical protein